MNVGSLFAVSASALQAQRMRMDLISGNLANAQTTQTPGGGAYRRRDVVLESMPLGESFADLLSGDSPAEGVHVKNIVQDRRPPRRVYDPDHPHAGTEGFVEYPNVNIVAEMVDMMAATRAYEANVTAMNATKRMVQAALEIGQG